VEGVDQGGNSCAAGDFSFDTGTLGTDAALTLNDDVQFYFAIP